MSQALRDTAYLGIPTNVDFLRRIVDDAAFRGARLRTDMLRLRPELAAGPQQGPEALALAAAVLCQAVEPAKGVNGGGAAAGARSNSVWRDLEGFRLFEDRR